jgi:hypothetical protein
MSNAFMSTTAEPALIGFSTRWPLTPVKFARGTRPKRFGQEVSSLARRSSAVKIPSAFIFAAVAFRSWLRFHIPLIEPDRRLSHL